jgi:pyruvate/2-oxoglutarate dehydrogenase complex dihydrolipoamide dehydrogenase (E3) component
LPGHAAPERQATIEAAWSGSHADRKAGLKNGTDARAENWNFAKVVDKPNARAKKKNWNFPKTVDKQTVDKLPAHAKHRKSAKAEGV